MTYKEKILKLLSDGNWHNVNELIRVYYKYTQRIYDLRKEGYLIETKRHPEKHNAFANFKITRGLNEVVLESCC